MPDSAATLKTTGVHELYVYLKLILKVNTYGKVVCGIQIAVLLRQDLIVMTLS